MAIDWNSIYAEELARIEDPTNTINNERETALGSLTTNKDSALKSLQDLQTGDETALSTAKGAQEKTLKDTLTEALRQAYISREMNKKDLPALMSNLGLTGGVTETAASDLLRGYRNSKNSADKNYNTSLTDLGTGYNSNLAALRSQYGKQSADLINTYNTNYGNTQSSYQQQLRDALATRLNNVTTNTNNRYAQATAAEQAEWERKQASMTPAASSGGGGGDDAYWEQQKKDTLPNAEVPEGFNPYAQAGYAGAGDAGAMSKALDDSMARQGKEKVVTQYGTFYR